MLRPGSGEALRFFFQEPGFGNSKPLDKVLLLSHAQSHGSIITMEDNVLAGGFGSAVLECLEEEGIVLPVRRFGWPDHFIEHGNSVSSLREAHGLGDEQIFAQIEKFLKL